MTHLDDEKLSALIDGELPPAAVEPARAHAAACPKCAARLERLKGASAAFRRVGAAAMPTGLATRAKAGASAPRRILTWTLATAAVSVILVLAAGVAVKTFLPTLFNNVQQMITGAAGPLGK